MPKRTVVIVAAAVIVFVILAIIAGSLFSGNKEFVVPPRSEAIPANVVKMTPQTDLYPRSFDRTSGKLRCRCQDP